MRMRSQTILSNGSINEFIGWDYMELASKWDLFNPQSPACKLIGKEYKEPDLEQSQDDSKPLREFLEDLIKVFLSTQDDAIIKPYATDVRQFARKLAKEDESFYKPLWRGLARIEDDFTIVRATILLLPCMWS